MKNFKYILLAVALITLSIFGCNRCSKSSSVDSSDKETFSKQVSQIKQLNLSILLDMSDRITVNGIIANDIENIRTITEFYKKNMEELGAYNAKGKIRIFFSPTPTNTNINSLVSKLQVDCSKIDNKGRKKVYDEISENYIQNLEKIYKETISTSEFYGADIWRFFKDDVKDFCIDKDTSYRNILIILTDGYLYHKQSYYNNGNRYTYLLGSNNLKPYRDLKWQQLVEQDDFGIMTERQDLNDIEVLVLEVKAENPSYKIDEDILRYTWRKWFQEMNVAQYEVYPSDLPANTKTRIESFLGSK